MHGRRSWKYATLAGVAAAALAACGDEVVVQVPPPESVVETFEQRKASAIDILFVIDDSGSMEKSQDTLSRNFSHFFHLIDPDREVSGEPGEVDYRLAIATTDVIKKAGQLEGKAREPLVLRGDQDYDPLEIFEERVIVGTDGSAREEAFRAAELALDTAGRLKDADGKADFLRNGAYLYVVFVSDEDDDSRDEVRYFERHLRSLKGKGNEGTVIVSAIAGPVSNRLPESCYDEKGDPIAARGDRYWDLVQATGGSFGNICLPDWAETLEELAFTGLGLRKRFQLSRVARYIPDENGIPDLKYLLDHLEVHYPCNTSLDSPFLSDKACSQVVDACGTDDPKLICRPPYDTNQENGFWYDERENSIAFAGAAIPGPGSVVEVKYLPRDKW